MKLIKPSYQILEQKPGLKGIYEMIELAGRTCYKSTRKEGTTAKDFVDRMINSKHYAMLEHGTVYLLFSECCYSRSDREFIDKYTKNPYSKVVYIGTDDSVEQTPGKEDYLGNILGTGVYGNALYAITTNYRVLVENDWLDDLQYLCEPTEFHEKRVTVKFTTSNGIMREFTRHRSHSFAVESTRYCNYSKDRFNNEIQCIIPSWSKGMIEGNSYDWEFVHDYNLRQTEGLSEIETRLIMSWCYDEAQYLLLLKKSFCTPQQAREVLPLATKCDMVMTGFVSDWEHFFQLRTSIIAETGKPHPDASALADPLYKEFVDRGYIK